ncbi:hypothetical protein IJH89_00130 [Candidatus Saccharibacteria bacterium]|nr:hypothetical protein [Candidatus Saccharibacteria bacterium]
MKSVVHDAEILILATPAEAVKKLFDGFSEEWFRKPLIVATKGLLEEGVYERFSHFEMISGPGFASEILKGRRIWLTVACRGIEAKTTEGISGDTLAETIFRNTNIVFDRTDDVRGVRLVGALKNIYAIEAGREGLEPRTREFTEFVEAAIREMKMILLDNGGFVETVEKVAGRGDLILTCSIEENRNYRFGRDALRERGLRWRANARRVLRELRTVEGVFGAEQIKTEGVFVPREAEILENILRRIYAVKR